MPRDYYVTEHLVWKDTKYKNFQDFAHSTKANAQHTHGYFWATWKQVWCLNEVSTQTPWPLVREQTIPTERPPLVDKI
jgi:hypothetical protein